MRLFKDGFKTSRVGVQPQHAANILSGSKTLELRRRFNGVPQGCPDQANIGLARVRDVQKMLLSKLWKSVREQACISKAERPRYRSSVEILASLRATRRLVFCTFPT